MSTQSASTKRVDTTKVSEQRIVPYLWFDGDAEEAINFYVALFPDSKILNISRYKDAGPEGKETVTTASFLLSGQEFMALNGGPKFKFSEAVSFYVKCESQAEVDELWNKILANGGKEQRCGWIKDRFGLSWQIIPNILGELLQDKDPQKSRRVMNAMLQMVKIDINGLEQAYEQD